MKGIQMVLVVAAAMTCAVPRAHAAVAEGQPAPAFTKNQLDSPGLNQTTPRSLSDYSGKVVFLFMMGYNCSVCLGDGASVEQNIHDYYSQNFPGQVAVIAADHYNGTAVQLRTFQTSTGATYPLLLRASDPTSGIGNMGTLYGPNDVHIVINKKEGAVAREKVIYCAHVSLV